MNNSSYLDAGLFIPLDLYFAQRVLSTEMKIKEEHTVFLAFLFALSRQGHLAFPLERIKEIMGMLPSKRPFDAEELMHKVQEGAKALPTCCEGLVYENNGVYYLQKNWACEQDILCHILRLLHSSPMPIPSDAVDMQLNCAQRAAIEKAKQYPISLLFGGPGTGKTYTAAQLIRGFLTADEKKQMRVVVAAPTGKAVAQLDMYLKRLLGDEERIRSGTCHALLNLKKDPSLEHDSSPLFADIILVDECSMIDAPLFSRLLASIMEGSRVILIGDPDQLPSVEAGSIFADLVAAAQAGFALPATQLTECLRSERKEILYFSECVRTAQCAQAVALLQGEGIARVPLDLLESNRQQVYSYLFHVYKEHFISFFTDEPNASDLLRKLDSFRLLSCMRQGDFGVDAINHFFIEQFSKEAPRNEWWAIPLLITRSDYALQLYNGDTGILIRRTSSSLTLTQEDYAYFPDRASQEGLRKIPALALPSFEWGYCLSVHKSQGSEYEEVFILIPQGSEVFGREVLYTAATRAKRAITCAGSLEVIEKVIQNSARKISGLSARLKEKVSVI